MTLIINRFLEKCNDHHIISLFIKKLSLTQRAHRQVVLATQRSSCTPLIAMEEI
jgi:hypothetical protein